MLLESDPGLGKLKSRGLGSLDRAHHPGGRKQRPASCEGEWSLAEQLRERIQAPPSTQRYL